MNIVNVFDNISKNFLLLESDFIGLQFNISGFLHALTSFFQALLFILTYDLIGRKIRALFKYNSYKALNCFINIGIGYIFVNSGLAILGTFSLLYPSILWIFIIAVLGFTLYPYSQFRGYINSLYKVFNKIKTQTKDNKWVFLGTILFICIAFFRLIPPETGEDAIGYHTSNPHLFLKNHTMIIESKAPPHVLLAPHLGEMSYLIFDFIGNKDASRYLHFTFYFLVVFLIFYLQPYSALLFATAPVVIQVSSKANVDFQWILCWLLAIYIVTKSKRRNIKDFMLAGILFGGVLASKLWVVAFYPLFILYLLIVYRKDLLTRKLQIILIFSLCAFSIYFIWLWRAYSVSGNPVYPAFALIERLENFNEPRLTLLNYTGFNKLMFDYKNLIVLSPLFFLGIIGILFNFQSIIRILRKSHLFLFFTLLGIEYLFIQYHFGRYLLGLYSVAIVIISSGVNYAMNRYVFYKAIFITLYFILFFYYFVNTLLTLPYGLGWADKNKYLTRTLSRDNSSYYDFDKKFDRWISKNDKVATYETFGFYYADFDYIDVNYIFDNKNKSINKLRIHGITKLFIKGGDIKWFCERLRLTDCDNRHYKLLANYTPHPRYLYAIIE